MATSIQTLGEVNGVLGQGPLLARAVESFSIVIVDSAAIGFAAVNLATETDPQEEIDLLTSIWNNEQLIQNLYSSHLNYLDGLLESVQNDTC